MLAMIIKGAIIVLLIAVIVSLGTALVRLVSDRGQSERTVVALTIRIGLSIGLFLLIVASVLFGWINRG